jgi:hypothetical protein
MRAAAPDLPGPTEGSPDATFDQGPHPSYDCQNPAPDWLFCEDFEGMSAGFDAWFASSGWTDSIGDDDRGRMTTSTEAHTGQYAVYMPAAADSGYRGATLRWRPCVGENRPGCTLEGYDKLYFRAWVRFAPDHHETHHFLSVGGGPLDDYWAPYGNAGCRPNGRRSMGTTVDFKAGSHESLFYTYFPDMHCDPESVCDNYADPQSICDGCATKDMPCTDGLECCWGNHFKPDPPVALPVGSWFCLEIMMKANTVGQSDGEMAYWVDGALAHHVKDMLWRTDSNLQLNKANLQHYITTSDADGHSNRVWFDDVVVSTARIGCD